MAIRSTYVGSGILTGSSTVSSNTSGYYDPRYEAEKQAAYYREMERQRMLMQQQAYNPYTDTYHGGVTAQQVQEGQKPKPMPVPEHLTNKKLLLLEK